MQHQRSQHKNRAMAMQILAARVAQHERYEPRCMHCAEASVVRGPVCCVSAMHAYHGVNTDCCAETRHKKSEVYSVDLFLEAEIGQRGYARTTFKRIASQIIA